MKQEKEKEKMFDEFWKNYEKNERRSLYMFLIVSSFSVGLLVGVLL